MDTEQNITYKQSNWYLNGKRVFCFCKSNDIKEKYSVYQNAQIKIRIYIDEHGVEKERKMT